MTINVDGTEFWVGVSHWNTLYGEYDTAYFMQEQLTAQMLGLV